MFPRGPLQSTESDRFHMGVKSESLNEVLVPGGPGEEPISSL